MLIVESHQAGWIGMSDVRSWEIESEGSCWVRSWEWWELLRIVEWLKSWVVEFDAGVMREELSWMRLVGKEWRERIVVSLENEELSWQGCDRCDTWIVWFLTLFFTPLQEVSDSYIHCNDMDVEEWWELQCNWMEIWDGFLMSHGGVMGTILVAYGLLSQGQREEQEIKKR